MPRLLCLLLVLGIASLPADVEAKGGPKGKGRSSSGFKSTGQSGKQRGISQPQGRSGTSPAKQDGTFGSSRGQGSAKHLGGESTSPRLKGRDHALNTQRLNEDRKLAHRQQTAQKLREIGERNGNDNLLRTADKMDQQALDHYDKRLSRIASQTPDGVGSAIDGGVEPGLDQQPLTDAAADQLQDVSLLDSEQLDGLSSMDAQRLAQEDRKLQHQLDVAQRLRDNAARNGNENLLRTAERMETMAADRYQSQLEKFGLFTPPQQPIVLPPAPIAPPL